MNSVLNRPELLAPAGNMEKLRTCLLYGADAVYLGGKSGNLRAACEGFSAEELREALGEAAKTGARVYYCLNSLPMQADMAVLPAQIEDAAAAGVHGFIIADPGVLRLAERYAPGVPVHLSTQANTTNSESIAFWKERGVQRVNLARELTCRDIHAVRKACPDMELEVFVHGAMCLAVSGQCLLSAWLNDRSGNQGRCTQPCRFEYRQLAGCQAQEKSAGGSLVVEEYTRPGEPLWRVEREERFSSLWATQDLCLLPWLPWFVSNRVDALKIEGRMKSAGYVAHVVDAYRTLLQACVDAGTGAWPDRLGAGMDELLFSATRPLGSGFFLHGARRNLTAEYIEKHAVDSRPNRSGEGLLPQLGHAIVARVVEEIKAGAWLVDVRSNWRNDKDVELMLPGLRRPVLRGGGYRFENQRGELADMLGNGVRGVLYADNDAIMPGIFIRAAL